MAIRKQDGVPRELERAGALCLALANTEVPAPHPRFKVGDDGPAYRFDDYGEIVTWGQRMGALTAAEAELLIGEAAARPDEAAAVVTGFKELRAAVMRYFTLSRSAGSRPRSISPP